MKRILKWLATMFARYSGAVEGDERHTPVGTGVRPTESAQDAAVKKGLKSYNSTEAGEFLQLKPDAVCDRVRSGELVAYKPGRAWVFLEEDLIRYLKSTRPETVLNTLHACPRPVPTALPAAAGARRAWIDLFRLVKAKSL